MLNKNSLLIGFFIALVFPVIAFAAAYLLKNTTDIINRPALPYFIAIALNLILLRISYKKELEQTGKGIMLSTFVVMLLVFLFKIHPIR